MVPEMIPFYVNVIPVIVSPSAFAPSLDMGAAAGNRWGYILRTAPVRFGKTDKSSRASLVTALKAPAPAFIPPHLSALDRQLQPTTGAATEAPF